MSTSSTQESQGQKTDRSAENDHSQDNGICSGHEKANGPLSGLRVLEFSHTVMGPCAGLLLADLGADVIKVEPPGGDKTRALLSKGFGVLFAELREPMVPVNI